MLISLHRSESSDVCLLAAGQQVNRSTGHERRGVNTTSAFKSVAIRTSGNITQSVNTIHHQLTMINQQHQASHRKGHTRTDTDTDTDTNTDTEYVSNYHHKQQTTNNKPSHRPSTKHTQRNLTDCKRTRARHTNTPSQIEFADELPNGSHRSWVSGSFVVVATLRPS